MTLTTVVAFSATLAFTAATAALAAASEKPEVKVEQTFATTANFHGILSPKSPGELGAEYQFVYRVSAKSECKGAGEIKTPASPGMSLGGEHEELPTEPVSALKPKTEYAVCLSVTNIAKTETVTSAAFPFKTAAAAKPEPPEATEVTERKATTATLNGIVNPLNEGEPGKYSFLFRQSAGECKGAGEVATPEEPAPGASPQPVSAAITGLEPGKPYTFCVKVSDALGEATLSTPTTFTAALPPETPETKPAIEVIATSWNLRGVLNPNAPGEPGTYEFRYRASATECEGEDHEGEGEHRTSAQSAAGGEGEAVEAEVTGLLPTTTYTFCLRAENGAGEVAMAPPETFTTPVAAPVVTDESFSTVGSTTATLNAQIDPGGAPTAYRVEYGTSVPYGSSTAEVSLPGSTTPVAVQEQLSGLQAGTLYHFRFVATNSLGTIPGGDTTFMTVTSGGPSSLTLPDNRSYELVSPALGSQEVYSPFVEVGLPQQGAGDIVTERPALAARDGNSVVYAGDPPGSGEGGDGSTGNDSGNQYLATRNPQRGWEASDVTPAKGGLGTTYEPFSTDVSSGVISSALNRPPGSEPLTASVAENPSLLGCDILYSDSTSTALYQALFTTTQTPHNCGVPVFAGAARGNSPVLFQTSAALSSEAEQAAGGAEEEEEDGGSLDNLYASAGGQLHSVNVVGGKPAPNATFGGVWRRLKDPPDFSNAISADGSRIFWTALEDVENEGTLVEVKPKALYLRENATQPPSPLGPEDHCAIPADACTVQLDVTHGSGASGGGQFWSASSDGSKVLFTDCSRLTAESTAVSGSGCAHVNSNGVTVSTGNDLYQFDVNSGQLTDLTPDVTDPLGADVQGVIGGSEDGSYVYVVAGGVLAGNDNAANEKATLQTCQEPSDAEEQEEENLGHLDGRGCNLYLLHEGQPVFIATLAPGDNHLPAVPSGVRLYGDWQPDLGSRTAEVTPDGRHLVFESEQRLTRYDNGGSKAAKRAIEAFVFDADSGQLSCASCNPTGAPPSVVENDARSGVSLPVSSNSTFMRRWINKDGTNVFFDSVQPLVPQDTNGKQDVYEWAREGTGSCPQGVSGGACIYLLSGGTNSDNAFFVDANSAGSDAFITSRAQLVPQDKNDRFDLYDARIGGGFPEASLACTGTGCQGAPPAPPSFATPSTATFNGGGNFPPPPPKMKTAAQVRAERLARALKACRLKRRKHARTSCEAQARKRYRLSKTKRSAHGKRKVR